MRHDEFDDCMEMARALLGGYEGAGDLWEANEHVNRALRSARHTGQLIARVVRLA